jgi:hypothetical protein
MTRRRIARPLAAAAALATLAIAGACSVPGFYEGGSRASNDLHVYVSRPHSPKTVSLVNTVSGETIWSVDIPVGQQLVVRFYDNQYKDPINSAQMNWDLMKETTSFHELKNQMPVPASAYRRLDMELRSEPELPQAADAGA